MEDCNRGCEEHLRGMQIGKDLQKRLKTGEVDDERITLFEEQQQKKLDCVDEAHTTVMNLTFEEAQRYIMNFEEFLEESSPPACPELKDKVFECLKENSGDSLRCSAEVAAFSNCVDETMRALNRSTTTGYDATSKKLSYMEKFQQSSDY